MQMEAVCVCVCVCVRVCEPLTRTGRSCISTVVGNIPGHAVIYRTQICDYLDAQCAFTVDYQHEGINGMRV